MNYMTVGLNKKVSLVLLPIDDFTDRIITGSQLRMYTEDGKKPSIRKTDGYHVFCDLAGERVRICVEGPLYQRQTVEIELKQDLEIVKLRMIPGAGYPIPAGSTCVRGKLPPKSRLRLYFPEQKRSYKLLYDYDPVKQGNELALFLPETVQLEGKTLCIRGLEGMEFFRVTGQKGEVFTVEQPLGASYKKIGTSIFPVYETYAAADGSVYLPIRTVFAEENPCICLLQTEEGEDERRAEQVLLRGKENKVTEEWFRKEG